MIPRWILMAVAAAVLGAVIAVPARWYNRMGAWEEAAGEWKTTAGKEKKARTAWQVAFSNQKANYRAAQRTARKLALEDKQRDLRSYKAYQERVDNAEQELTHYRALAERYARANRVRKPSAGTAGGNAGATGPASAGDLASGDNRSGGATDVVISRPDFDTLVDNSIRLKSANKWGNDLVAAGLATKVD